MSFQAPIGTRDIFAPESKTIGALIAKFASLVELAGFDLLISPLFEDYEVFARSAGQASEVVSKEMYVFSDRGGREMALRPEGTASVVRAFIQHQNPTPFKAWYATPAFRYEKPQAGRYRQHHQLGLEVIGSASPSCDIEIIELATSFLKSIGISNFTLLVNSMGDENCRPLYREALLDYLGSKKTELCQDHQDRFKLNPLRVLDCKKPECTSVTKDAPMIDAMLCQECSSHHQEVLKGLSLLAIDFISAPRLVRGFDYYTRTTFEIQSNSLDSSQNAIGGGGRYDKLVEKLGGKSETPGIGFGMGLERLVLVLEANGIEIAPKQSPDVYLVDLSSNLNSPVLAGLLRRCGISVDYSYEKGSMKSQMRHANKSGATLAIIFGQRELERGLYKIKDLATGEESEVPLTAIEEAILEKLSKIG